MDSNPVPLTQQKLIELDPNPNTQLYLGGIWGYCKGGQTWLATDGKRLVLSADSTSVVFIILDGSEKVKGRAFIQSAAGFQGEVTTYPFIEGARRAAPLAKLIEYEVELILGVFSAVSGVGFVAVLGADVLRFVVENRTKFPMWQKAIEVTLSVRSILKQYAPTLWDKIVDVALTSAWKGTKLAVGLTGGDVAANLPAAMATNPKIVGRGLGALLGKLGKNALAGRLSALRVIWTILWTVVTKGLSGVPGAVKLTPQEFKAKGQEMVESLKRAGVAISQQDAEKVLQEVQQNAPRIQEALRRLKEAYAAVE